MNLATLRIARAAMSDRKTVAAEVARRLGSASFVCQRHRAFAFADAASGRNAITLIT